MFRPLLRTLWHFAFGVALVLFLVVASVIYRRRRFSFPVIRASILDYRADRQHAGSVAAIGNCSDSSHCRTQCGGYCSMLPVMRVTLGPQTFPAPIIVG